MGEKKGRECLELSFELGECEEILQTDMCVGGGGCLVLVDRVDEINESVQMDWRECADSLVRLQGLLSMQADWREDAVRLLTLQGVVRVTCTGTG